MLLFSWEESPQIIRVRIKAAVLSFVVFFFKATVSLYMNESGTCVCWDQKGLDTDTLSWSGSAYSSLRRNLRIMLWRGGGRGIWVTPCLFRPCGERSSSFSPLSVTTLDAFHHSTRRTFVRQTTHYVEANKDDVNPEATYSH